MKRSQPKYEYYISLTQLPHLANALAELLRAFLLSSREGGLEHSIAALLLAFMTEVPVDTAEDHAVQ